MVKFRNLVCFIFILLVLLMISKKYSYEAFADDDMNPGMKFVSLTVDKEFGDTPCLTGYYGDACDMSVVGQPLNNCPSNYYKDSACKIKGCIKTQCRKM